MIRFVRNTVCGTTLIPQDLVEVGAEIPLYLVFDASKGEPDLH